jgi:hypothetical protein
MSSRLIEKSRRAWAKHDDIVWLPGAKRARLETDAMFQFWRRLALLSALGVALMVGVIVGGEQWPTWLQVFMLTVLVANFVLMLRALNRARAWQRWKRYLT